MRLIRRSIRCLILLLSGALALGIAVVTVSTRTVRAAHTNPADVLRDE